MIIPMNNDNSTIRIDNDINDDSYGWSYVAVSRANYWQLKTSICQHINKLNWVNVTVIKIQAINSCVYIEWKF